MAEIQEQSEDVTQPGYVEPYLRFQKAKTWIYHPDPEKRAEQIDGYAYDAAIGQKPSDPGPG